MWEVLWAPHNPNKFVKYRSSDVNSDIILYNVYNQKEDVPAQYKKSAVQLTEDWIVPINAYSEFSSVKSIAWCPHEDLKTYCILGVGSSNGKLSLLNLGLETPSQTGLLLNHEFAPKSERTCHELSWNDAQPNLLAVGLDKVRYDNSLLVWDVEAKSVVSPSPSAEFTVRKPYFERGASEPTVSVQWLPNNAKTLVAGQGSKWLRLFDLRTPDPKIIATTKAIYGITVDQRNHNRIATFAEGAVLVWDIRNYEKPLLTLNQTTPVAKIRWCPTRNDILSVLHKDSSVFKYYDLQYSTGNKLHSIDGEVENILSERMAQLPKTSKDNISSFSWHPSIENTILTISTTGELSYLKIYERITMSWSPSFELVWGCGKNMISCTNMETGQKEDDISFIMKRRAIAGYGDKFILKDEKRLREVLKDQSLLKLWSWLKRARRIIDSDSRKNRKFYGVKAIINGELNMLVDKPKAAKTSSNKGRAIHSVIEDNETVKILARQYTSPDRTVVLRLCEWEMKDSELRDRLTRMAREEDAERAAAMALFNNKLTLCIDLLSDTRRPPSRNPYTPDSALPIVAMALSGYSERKQPLWLASCKQISAQLTNPYLRAIFAFLTAEDEDYNGVLKETGMKLEDRVAFACRYLSDSKLTTYIDNLTTSLISNGNLEGLLLTGIAGEGIDLIGNFINKTCDVQTAILMIVCTKVAEAMKDQRVTSWIENYRDLLDQWRLWNERAQFDALVQGSEYPKSIPQQINVTCTYCSKPVSHNFINSGGMRGATRYPRTMGGGGQKNKAMACPGCRQPLPRCSICHLNMGSLSSHSQRAGNRTKHELVVNSFLNWFTWCQMCRHGGHASHLMQWFDGHIQCPVTGCTCSCNAHDSISMVTPNESGPNETSEGVKAK